MVTQKEFLADIDVALGGRVAEELIFGPENVTSGASSDLRKATATATHMVKASQTPPSYIPMANVTLCLVHRIGDIRKRLAQCISTIEKRASPQANVRRLKTKCGGEGEVPCSGVSIIPLIIVYLYISCRMLQAGQARVFALLRSKQQELHRVSFLRVHLPAIQSLMHVHSLLSHSLSTKHLT
jgi:Peptidase family M41